MTRFPLLGAFGAALFLAACGPEEPADNATGPEISEEAVEPADVAPEMPEVADDVPEVTLADIVAGDHRVDANTARDPYRHPLETLEFFGLERDMTVLEIWPGSGFYTDIVAPYVAGEGQYIAAIFDESGGQEYVLRLNKELREKIDGNPMYGPVQYVTMGEGMYDLGPEASVDMVLTFRNVHSWMRGGNAQDVFNAMFKVLKPGGTLGLVQHRNNPDAEQDPKAPTGYVTEKAVIDMAEAAGFTLADKSEVNANPADTKDYEGGVWTLPPALRGEEEDKTAYEAIGESDRMTLKFVKPETTGLAMNNAQ
ncbi:MAG: class I SAM-dependent methyltransferase [Alphaproteobacteria bacterium]